MCPCTRIVVDVPAFGTLDVVTHSPDMTTDSCVEVGHASLVDCLSDGRCMNKPRWRIGSGVFRDNGRGMPLLYTRIVVDVPAFGASDGVTHEPDMTTDLCVEVRHPTTVGWLSYGRCMNKPRSRIGSGAFRGNGRGMPLPYE